MCNDLARTGDYNDFKNTWCGPTTGAQVRAECLRLGPHWKPVEVETWSEFTLLTYLMGRVDSVNNQWAKAVFIDIDWVGSRWVWHRSQRLVRNGTTLKGAYSYTKGVSPFFAWRGAEVYGSKPTMTRPYMDMNSCNSTIFGPNNEAFPGSYTWGGGKCRPLGICPYTQNIHTGWNNGQKTYSWHPQCYSYMYDNVCERKVQQLAAGAALPDLELHMTYAPSAYYCSPLKRGSNTKIKELIPDFLGSVYSNNDFFLSCRRPYEAVEYKNLIHRFFLNPFPTHLTDVYMSFHYICGASNASECNITMIHKNEAPDIAEEENLWKIPDEEVVVPTANLASVTKWGWASLKLPVKQTKSRIIVDARAEMFGATGLDNLVFRTDKKCTPRWIPYKGYQILFESSYHEKWLPRKERAYWSYHGRYYSYYKSLRSGLTTSVEHCSRACLGGTLCNMFHVDTTSSSGASCSYMPHISFKERHPKDILQYTGNKEHSVYVLQCMNSQEDNLVTNNDWFTQFRDDWNLTSTCTGNVNNIGMGEEHHAPSYLKVHYEGYQFGPTAECNQPFEAYLEKNVSIADLKNGLTPQYYQTIKPAAFVRAWTKSTTMDRARICGE